jgi:NADH-quinone oxidoreductase subunit N
MASLAGIPLTAGFFGKFFVFQLAVAAKAWWLLGVASLAAACGFYYYLKVVRAMYFIEPEPGQERAIRLSFPTKGILTLLTVAIFAFGVNPSPLVKQPHTDEQSKPTAEQPAAQLSKHRS